MGTIRDPNDAARFAAGGLTDAATTFIAANATLITDTTAQAIKAAPGAGKHLKIKGLTASNATAAEISDITVQDDAGTPVILYRCALTGVQTHTVYFDPPIKTSSNVAVKGKAAAATGDSSVTIWGFVDDD